ncbi:hypothetical protein Ddye_028469 [Dipteronia dyeriana]|uniref:NB-ARC domain-containing protein n=1 Tax=Dipteronia dyeriana TaxID=168575 RepID=A0AAD9TR05_9ROSI|nr:hypothetical protein Ddye_028469 [Dipteronia dyeriana]
MYQLIPVAVKVAKYLGEPVVRPFIYIWNYKTNFQNLQSEVNKLEGKQNRVQHSVDQARSSGEDIEHHVSDWLDSVKKTVDETSEIIREKERSNTKCFMGLCPNPKKRYHHSRKAVDKAKSVVELRKEENLKNVSYRTVPEEIWIPSYKRYKDFDSRRSIVEDVLNVLSNPDVNLVGIYGAGGIGKTMLAREVAKHVEDKKLFDVVAFAEVSAVPDIRTIQGEIADMLGLTFKEEDDSKGCKVLLTARDLDVLTGMGSQHNFSIDVLNDQEAWNLFSTTAGGCVEQNDLQVSAKDVAKACGGFPISIVTISSALRYEGEFEWKDALTKLTTPSSMEATRNRVNRLVRQLKSSSLLLDANDLEGISMHDVIRDVVVANGICKLNELRLLDLRKCTQLEAIPPNIILSLTQLEELYLGTSYIDWEVQGGSNASLDDLKCQPQLTGLEIYIPHTNVLPKGLFSKMLERYDITIGIYSGNSGLHEKWNKTTPGKLELNLGNNCSCFWDVLHETPSVKNFVSALEWGEGFLNLKHLWVAFPSLEKIVISNMKNLEMIWHKQLAENSFDGLTSIKVDECTRLSTIFQFNMLQRSTRLQSLTVNKCNSLEVIFDLQGVNFEESSHSAISSLLRELHIEYLPKMRHIWNKDPKGTLSFQELSKVMIRACRSLKNIFPASIAMNLSQLEQLYIERCEVEEIVAEEEGADPEAVTRFHFPRLISLEFDSLEQLRCFYPGRHTAEWPALIKLSMFASEKIGLIASEETNNEGRLSISVQQPLFFVEKGYLLKLEELHLSGESCRMISQALFSEHLIPKLKFLKVSADFSEVFPFDILWRYPKLEKLELDYCSSEEIFSHEEVEKHAEMLARIKSLQLSRIATLKHIWKQHPKLDLILQSLQILKVSNCGSTDAILPSSASFRNLKILHVENCHELTSILTSSTV